MERGDDGYTHVVAGMPEPGSHLPPSARRRLSDEDRRALVERLRAQGWSYRRISSELNISYAAVARWLDGPEAAGPPLPPLPVRLGAPRPPHAAAATARAPEPEPPAPAAADLVEHLIAQNRALLDRVDRLTAAVTAQRQAIAELESRLVATMDDQHRKLGDRILDALRLLRRIIPG
ncbi:helix-turn-helix domain-containing protein [Azospirillum sp. ST 5-10]|uniref:helix-turn-helix domain-containing protein n=1 Tax=unclassified Azospirillum TaxID=2630922 RepID=UPI003F4A2E29